MKTSQANRGRLRGRRQSRDGSLSVGVCDPNVSGGKTGHNPAWLKTVCRVFYFTKEFAR
jgi:hypothetical protein